MLIIKEKTAIVTGAGGGNSSKNPCIPVMDTAHLAVQRCELERPISVCTRELPDWLSATMNRLALEQMTFADALQDYAEQPA